MCDYPSLSLGNLLGIKVGNFIHFFLSIRIFDGTYSVFVPNILVNFVEVLLRWVQIRIANDGKLSIQLFVPILNILSYWTVVECGLYKDCNYEASDNSHSIIIDKACVIRFQQNTQYILTLRQSIIQTQMQLILDHQYDISKPIYMIHPQNKFWEVKLQAKNVTFRVGKVKDAVESGVEQVQKEYASVAAARASVIQKINDKLTKGYICPEAKKKQGPKKQSKEKQEAVVRKDIKKGRHFSGDYYQKGNQSIKLQVNGKRVKITKVSQDKKQGFQIRSFDSNEDAITFCLQEEEWIKSEGFKAMNHKFIYSFVGDMDEEKKESRTKPKNADSKRGNVLSITQMTDDAISHRSRNTSSAKSDRSAQSGDEEDNEYIDTQSKLGRPTSECIKVLLAETYKEDSDPTGWIMSEKLDGVRCFWTGTTMYSRNGNRFFFPKFFTKNWPKSQLDGQLFIGRGKFSETLSAIKKGSPIDEEWRKVRYLVFDCPGLKKPFRQRIKAMEEVLSAVDNPYIKCHAHRECSGFLDLFDELDKVNKAQGEGLMLRDPQSFYQNRRSNSLLKVKTFHDDEAVVLGYNPGTGRCTGMVGALRVRNTHGVEFDVGSGLTDDLRRRPPKIGTKITYKYQQFNKDSGKPRFPTYLRAYDGSI